MGAKIQRNCGVHKHVVHKHVNLCLLLCIFNGGHLICATLVPICTGLNEYLLLSCEIQRKSFSCFFIFLKRYISYGFSKVSKNP